VIFNSFTFLFLFLPIVLAVFFFPGANRARPYVLLVASVIFYGFSGLAHASVLVANITWVWVVTRDDAIVGGRIRLFLAIIVPLGTLFTFKYLDFVLSQFVDVRIKNSGFDLFTDVLLPAGISFFTFQLIAYAVDRFRGQIINPPSGINLALYISFFPQLIAGPIVRFRQVADPLKRLIEFRIQPSDWSAGIAYVVAGLAVKVLLADSIGRHFEPLVASPDSLSSLTSVFLLLAYGFQIYFDFYGYSLIAIGLGRFFGFRLPINFNRPFEARTPVEFWQRWHMTLMNFFNDYVYTPITVSFMRRSVTNRYGSMRALVIVTAIPILFVFLLSGIWHGAGWGFILWGIYQGLAVLLYRLTSSYWDRLPAILQRLATYTIITFSWIPFAVGLEGSPGLIASLFGYGGEDTLAPTAAAVISVGLAAAVAFGPRIEKIAESVAETAIGSHVRAIAFGLLFLGTLIFVDQSQTFIYFRF